MEWIWPGLYILIHYYIPAASGNALALYLPVHITKCMATMKYWKNSPPGDFHTIGYFYLFCC